MYEVDLWMISQIQQCLLSCSFADLLIFIILFNILYQGMGKKGTLQGFMTGQAPRRNIF